MQYISEQQKALKVAGLVEEKDELLHGGTHKGSKIYLNRTKTDSGDGETTHYEIHHADGKKHKFSVKMDDVPDTNSKKEHETIGKKAGLSADHPFVKAIHKSHTGGAGPQAWQE